MQQILKHICEYRSLRAKRDLIRVPLRQQETHRLEALEHLFAFDPFESEPPAHDRRRFMRISVALPAKVGEGQVTVVNIGGGGLVVSPAPELRRGDLTVVLIRDQETRREYEMPAQAVWQVGDVMGLAFVGMPSWHDLPSGNA